jgi:hypothetical protein
MKLLCLLFFLAMISAARAEVAISCNVIDSLKNVAVQTCLVGQLPINFGSMFKPRNAVLTINRCQMDKIIITYSASPDKVSVEYPTEAGTATKTFVRKDKEGIDPHTTITALSGISYITCSTLQAGSSKLSFKQN